MTPDDPNAEGPRLQKVLAAAGFGSRRVCEEMIADGRVTVDGATAVLGRRVDPDTAVIAIDDVVVSVSPEHVHYLLNKPAGVISTASDPQGRPTVVDLVPATPRVYPIGRLDMETEGLLLLTNDGDLTFRLSHPSFGIEKEYLAEISGTPPRAALRRLRDGVELDDGLTAPAKVSMPSHGLIRLTIHEGRNRQVRRMCEAIGYPVIRLVRTRIGPITDHMLAPGEWRPLRRDELRGLERAAHLDRDVPSAEPAPIRPAGDDR